MKRSRNAFVSCRLCVCCVIARVRCHVLQWKHLGLQLAGSRFDPRCRSRQNRIKRSGGSGKGAGGAAAPIARGRWRGALHISYGRRGAVTWCKPFVTCRQSLSLSRSPLPAPPPWPLAAGPTNAQPPLTPPIRAAATVAAPAAAATSSPPR